MAVVQQFAVPTLSMLNSSEKFGNRCCERYILHPFTRHSLTIVLLRVPIILLLCDFN